MHRIAPKLVKGLAQKGQEIGRRQYLTGPVLTAALKLPICKAFAQNPTFQTPNLCITSTKEVLKKLTGGHELVEHPWEEDHNALAPDRHMTPTDLVKIFEDHGPFVLNHYGYSQGYDSDSIHASIVAQTFQLKNMDAQSYISC